MCWPTPTPRPSSSTPASATGWPRGPGTGRPKGVMWRHEDLVVAGLGDLDGATTPEEVAERARRCRDRTLPACPLMHGAAQWVSLAAFFDGGTVILSPDARLD